MKQANFNNRNLIIGSGILMAVIIVLAFMVMTVIGSMNQIAETRRGIQAAYKNAQNVNSSYVGKLQETAQIPDKYAADLSKVYSATMEGRYGKDGSKAMFNWIQEHNPNFDSSLYQKLQTIIDEGRSNFEQSQMLVIDRVESGRQLLHTYPGGWFIGVANSLLDAPNRLTDEYLNSIKIITLASTQKKYETGTDEVTNVFGKKE